MADDFAAQLERRIDAGIKAALERAAARRRSLLARMAGNIAGGIEANANVEFRPHEVAQRAVNIAEAILAEVEKRG